jgi:hypothetical protein
VEAVRQDVDEEAADELICCEPWTTSPNGCGRCGSEISAMQSQAFTWRDLGAQLSFKLVLGPLDHIVELLAALGEFGYHVDAPDQAAASARARMVRGRRAAPHRPGSVRSLFPVSTGPRCSGRRSSASLATSTPSRC